MKIGDIVQLDPNLNSIDRERDLSGIIVEIQNQHAKVVWELTENVHTQGTISVSRLIRCPQHGAQEKIMPKNTKYWKCNFTLEILSKEGVSLEAFNTSLDKFVNDLIDVIPDTGTAAPESAIDSWHGGLQSLLPDEEQNLGKQK